MSDLHRRELRDNRKICQVCGQPKPVEYQVVHETTDGLLEEDEKMDLCPECGQKFVNNLQGAVEDIVNRGENEDTRSE